MKRILLVLTFVFMISFCAINVSATEVGYVTCDVLNVRVSPNTNCEIISKLYNGTQFEIIYADNGWYNIRMNSGVTGFVCADYVKKGVPDASSASQVALQVSSNAHKYLGYRYVYGAQGPNAFDCSGFTSYLYKQQGYGIPRTADVQSTYGMYVDKNNLAPGDLVFFSNRSDRKVNHVGVYVGGGHFIHAATSKRGVVMDSLYTNYYVKNYICARRIV